MSQSCSFSLGNLKDLLWQWVPVVSLAGWGSGRMPSRVASSITSNLSFRSQVDNKHGDDMEHHKVELQPHHCIVYSIAEYEDVVIR